MPLIHFQEVYRDSIQSLFGTNPSSEEIIEAHPNLTKTGVKSAQIAGGTFFAVMADKGRNPIAENENIVGYYKEHNDSHIDLSLLARGDILVGYEPYSYDVIKLYVQQMAGMGITQIQNFHGQGDTRAQEAVALACQEVREEHGLDIWAQGTICIEDNLNVTIEACLNAARELKKQGHKGFYLKSASGVVSPDFVKDLTQKLFEEFPDDQIGIHVHSTYGRAEACYLAAVEGAVIAEKTLRNNGSDVKVALQFDVAHPALAGNTGHPSMVDVHDLIKSHDDADIANAAPQLNFDAIQKDNASLREMRLRYRDFETVIDADLLEIMEEARVPGGASSTLKNVPNLVDNIGTVLGVKDWTEIQKAVYIMQKAILPDLGDPTQVTPYAANTTGQAGLGIFNLLSAVKSSPDLLTDHGDIIDPETNKINVKNLQDIVDHYKDDYAYKTLYGGPDGRSAVIAYLAGLHGKVPESINKDLQKRALDVFGVEQPFEYIPAVSKDPVLPQIKESIRTASSVETSEKMWNNESRKKPTVGKVNPSDVLMAALLKDGPAKVVAFKKNMNVPQEKADLPAFTRFGLAGVFQNNKDLISDVQAMVEHALKVDAIDRGHYDLIGNAAQIAAWREQAVGEFVDVDVRLHKNLLKYCKSANVDGADKKLSRTAFVEAQIAGCVKEAIDSRSTGLYDKIKEEVSDAAGLTCATAGLVSSYALDCRN